MATAGADTLNTASLQALLVPHLTAEQATPIFQRDREAVVIALLSLREQLAERTAGVPKDTDPSAPSGQTPPCAKPPAEGRAEAGGARPGPPGLRRPQPVRIGRLVERSRRHASALLTFLDHPGAPFDNNRGERQFRPAVIERKTSHANGIEDGAETQAILMSVSRTLRQRGHNAVSVVTDAVRTSLQAGKLPSPPGTAAELG